jgi:hypothetical protein
MRTILLAAVVASCATQHDDGPCETAALAYCDANLACDGNAAEHGRCVADATSFCASTARAVPDQSVADACASSWWGATCSVESYGNTIDVDPTMIACLESFWPCGDEGGTSAECAK